MKIYIDFDDVILFTSPVIFKEWLETHSEINVDDEHRKDYISSKNWSKCLEGSSIINDSIEWIKKMDKENTFILTRIHSLDNEGSAKVRYLRSHGIENNIILVPYDVSKKDIVDPKGNVLIDDLLFNLDDWSLNGGYGIFFNKDGDNMDAAFRVNSMYPSIKNLDINNINNIIEGFKNEE